MDSYVDSLKEMIGVISVDGNWNYNEYTFGMLNGMIFALYLVTGDDPQYKDRPERWLEDTNPIIKPILLQEEPQLFNGLPEGLFEL